MSVNTNKCPKCSSEMIHHPSSLSMPLTSSIESQEMKKVNIEDQDANFTFRFSSCSKCGFTEFYLVNKGIRV